MEIPGRHPRKGDCLIRERVHAPGRVKVLVDYPSLGLTRRPEYLDDLVDRETGRPIVLEAELPAPKRAAEAPNVPPWHVARQTLMALRLGQSTLDSVSNISVGMSEVDAACTWALKRAASGQISFLLFESPYGMGKSHALAHLRLLARKASMATGSVVLDGVGTSLCWPMALIAGLAHTINYPDESASDGLHQRLANVVLAGGIDKLNTAGCELLFSVLRRVDAQVASDPEAWETIEDFLSLEIGAGVVRAKLGLVVPALKTLRSGRPARCAELLKEWAQACSATGAPGGLVVLLDEADVDFAQSGRSLAEREQRSGLLEALRSLADIGPRHGGYGRLIIAMGVTPGSGDTDPVDELKEKLGPHLRSVVLRELSLAELKDLGTRVCRLYRAAYELPESETSEIEEIRECLSWLSKQAEQRNPRKFIRRLLETIDGTYA